LSLLDFLGFLWILSSESRLINGLYDGFGRKNFRRGCPPLRSTRGTGAHGPGTRKHRVAHRASLVRFPIILKQLSTLPESDAFALLWVSAWRRKARLSGLQPLGGSNFPQRLLARHICWRAIHKGAASPRTRSVHNLICTRIGLYKPAHTLEPAGHPPCALRLTIRLAPSRCAEQARRSSTDHSPLPNWNLRVSGGVRDCWRRSMTHAPALPKAADAPV
jgi:hypothetical protein